MELLARATDHRRAQLYGIQVFARSSDADPRDGAEDLPRRPESRQPGHQRPRRPGEQYHRDTIPAVLIMVVAGGISPAPVVLPNGQIGMSPVRNTAWDGIR